MFWGCGGGSTNPANTGPPQFNIASGNWAIPLSSPSPSSSPSPFAGGLLTQSGNKISGILYVSNSSCFDPLADPLMVQGTVSSDPNAAEALSLTTSPVRGQVLSVNATWDRSVLGPGVLLTSPPNPVVGLTGNWTLSGGGCAATGADGALAGFKITSFSGTWHGELLGPSTSSSGTLTAVLSQTGPDAQGFSHVSGTFSVTGSSCFAGGTVATTTFSGDTSQMSVTMDSGQLTGSAQMGFTFFVGAVVNQVTLNLVAHGGSCDGQSFTFTSSVP
jgi:hypothetical protein